MVAEGALIAEGALRGIRGSTGSRGIMVLVAEGARMRHACDMHATCMRHACNMHVTCK